MENPTRALSKLYSNKDWASVYSTMSGLTGVVIGLIIANFIGWI